MGCHTPKINLSIAITPQDKAESLLAHWCFPLDNKEVIKRIVIKMQTSWVFAQLVTYDKEDDAERMFICQVMAICVSICKGRRQRDSFLVP